MDSLEISWKIITLVGFFGIATGLWFIFIRPSVIVMPSDIEFANITSTELKTTYPMLFKWMGYVFVVFGTFISGLSLVTMWIAMTAYRKGEKWAWFAIATTDVPALLASLADIVIVGSDLVIVVAPMLLGLFVALILPVKKFFKRSD